MRKKLSLQEDTSMERLARFLRASSAFCKFAYLGHAVRENKKILQKSGSRKH